jgi:hypothetical protein
VRTMLYVLTFGGDAVTLESLPADEAARARAELDAWWRRNRGVGTILMAARLRAPLTATTIRFVEGQPVLQDGPFTPERDAIGGYGIIEVADLDAAVMLARSWPAGGYVEIRPLLSPRSPAEMIGYLRRITDTEGGHDR